MIENIDTHKALLGPDHFNGGEWECECGESFETKRELLSHVEDEEYAASPEGKRAADVRQQIRKEFKWPLTAYLEGLWTADNFIKAFPQYTRADLDKAWARQEEIRAEVRGSK